MHGFFGLPLSVHRQLIETFGSFARARLPKLSRPDVDEIKNLSTPIVIDQKKMGSNLRSTVGTATELATYIRLPTPASASLSSIFLAGAP